MESKKLKIGLLGNSRVGKSSICEKILGIEEPNEKTPTFGTEKFIKDAYVKNGQKISLHIWDTAGEDRFRTSVLKNLKIVSGIIIVFDVNNRSSFDSLNYWLEEIKDNYDNPKLVLFGNKADDIAPGPRAVSFEEACNFAKQNGLIYFETSAKTGKNLMDGFAYIINETYDKIYN